MSHYSVSKISPLVVGTSAGKLLAFCFGLTLFFTIPNSAADSNGVMHWVILFWYPTIGGIVGISNAIKQDFLFDLPWWLRAPTLGAWMNFMAAMLSQGEVQEFSVIIQLSSGLLSSPFWFVLDGLVIGTLCGFASVTVENYWEKHYFNSQRTASL